MSNKLPRYQQLTQWLQKKPLGQVLLSAEKEALDIVWSYVSGEYLLMLADSVQSGLVERAQVKNIFIVTSSTAQSSSKFQTICAEYEALPILANSVDAVLLPHTLEFGENPYQILRDATKALRPEGFLIILGFNPISLWGLRSLFSFGRTAPWSGSFRRASHVQEWLTLLNVELVEKKHAVYHFPFLQSARYDKRSVLERICQTCLPMFGGVYILVAKKKTFAAMLVQSKWNKMTASVNHGFAEPARRGMQNEENG